MSLDFSQLDGSPRLLLDVKLKPVQGTRFQPTGFPDLGAATFKGFDKDGNSVDCLLVESAQSMANRLESVCWNAATGELVEELKGLPYVVVLENEKVITTSILESHRLNSTYIWESNDKSFLEKLKAELGANEVGRVDIRLLARTLLKYDPNSLLHGIFLVKKNKLDGRLRLPRILSSFIEAQGTEIVASGGVKIDSHDPQGDTSEGFGNVIFHRDEYSAKDIRAFFNIDLAQLRGYGLGKDAEHLLIALALYKIQKFLAEGLRLRTACDLEAVEDVHVKKPAEFKLPELSDLKKALPKLIQATSGAFPETVITSVEYSKK